MNHDILKMRVFDFHRYKPLLITFQGENISHFEFLNAPDSFILNAIKNFFNYEIKTTDE